MKKIYLILGIILMVFVASCSNENLKGYLSSSDVMMALHCMEMKMSGCEEFEGIELTNEQIKQGCDMMPMMSICSEIEEEHSHDNSHPHDDEHIMMDEGMSSMMKSSGENFERSIEGLESVEKSQVLNLKNGDSIDLSIDIIKKEINRNEIRMFGYNGQIPGPLLRVKQDSIIYVNVTNNLDIETTVHWHGLRLDNEFDGVPSVTMDVQMPGESFEYKLDFEDEGIYWYHPHVREDYQQELGLYGNMLVESKYEDYYNNVNLEIPMILDDILIDDLDVEEFDKEFGVKTLMGRFGNIMLTNGDEDYKLEVESGDVVRFYITNVANTRTFNFSIPGISLKLIGSDIGSYEMEEYLDSIIIAPAERYTIEAYFENSGEFEMKNINPHNEYDLGTITVINSETENDYSSEFLSLRENKYVKEDIDKYREYFDKEVDVKIDLTVEMVGMESMMNMNHGTEIEWEDTMEMMNSMSTSESVKWILKNSETGDENSDIELDFKIGDKIKIRIFNDPKSAHPMQHPIHFHGQRFLVLEKDEVVNENLVWKDTVLVPVGSSVDILLDVTNPGEWMVHCHIAEHLESGMMMSFTVTKN